MDPTPVGVVGEALKGGGEEAIYLIETCSTPSSLNI